MRIRDYSSVNKLVALIIPSRYSLPISEEAVQAAGQRSVEIVLSGQAEAVLLVLPPVNSLLGTVKL